MKRKVLDDGVKHLSLRRLMRKFPGAVTMFVLSGTYYSETLRPVFDVRRGVEFAVRRETEA